MNPEELRVDQSTETFFGLVGSLSTGAAEEDVHTGAQSAGVQVYDDPLQPVAPCDDLFGLSSPHDVTGHVEQSSVHSIGHGSKSVEQRVADVAMSKSDYNRALFEARLSAVGDSELKLPWEQGVWKAIFTDDDSDVFPSVMPPVPGEYLSQAAAVPPESSDATEPAEKSLARSSIVSDPKMPFYSFAIRVLPDRDALEETEKVWLVALSKWHQVFEILSYPGELGRVILQELVTGGHADSSGALRDSLGIKSPRTAVKRAQTMIHFLTWLQVHVSNRNPWDRLQCLQYLQPDGHRRTSASRGMALLEAFRFSKYVLGIPIPEQLLNDPQLKGRAQRMMAGKASYNPARPLKVSELAFLETSMQKPLDPIDIYMLGAVIFAILSRSRWSDLRYIHQIWIEKMEYKGELLGFVEACTQHHKTATSLTKKQLYMPLVAPVLGVTKVDWTKHWTRACDALGINFEDRPFGALCRAASHGGTLCKRPCTTDEITIFLNRILSTNSENAVTSHSLKHTTLSWCAAYGLDEPSRTLLGHHELQGAKAMTVYSRDLLTRPLQLYCSMLENIRCDHFRPDESRTSRMVDLLKISSHEVGPGQLQREFVDPKQTAADDRQEDAEDRLSQSVADLDTQQDEVAEDEVSSELASTESSSGDSSSDDGSDGADHEGQHIAGPVLRNLKSHVVHRCDPLRRQTACGRQADEAHFELLTGGCSTLSARCSRCFKGEVISTVGGLVNALDAGKAKRSRLQ